MKQAIDEAIDAVGAQEEPPLPQRSSGAGGNGEHLVIYGLKSLNGSPWVQMHTYILYSCSQHMLNYYSMPPNIFGDCSSGINTFQLRGYFSLHELFTALLFELMMIKRKHRGSVRE